MDKTRRKQVLYMGLRTKQLIDTQFEINAEPVFTWLYFPVKTKNFYEVSIFSKHGLFKCRVFFEKPSYRYAFYYGTRLLGKSTRFKEYKTFIKDYINGVSN